MNIGKINWDEKEYKDKINEFYELYQDRPIKDNIGGMKSSHMFATWYILKKINPKIIIESGIWKGQSSWLLETTCPDAEIYSFDVTLDYRKYISKKIKYFQMDFSEYDWTKIKGLDKSLVFFDDHQNAYNRTVLCDWFGFKHIIFEDNYDVGNGDFYTMKHIFHNAGYSPPKGNFINNLEKFSYRAVRKAFGLVGLNPVYSTPQFHKEIVLPNDADSNIMKNKINVYYEFPPIFKPEKHTNYKDWDHNKSPTPIPILSSDEDKEKYKIFWEESSAYYWLCYLNLK